MGRIFNGFTNNLCTQGKTIKEKKNQRKPLKFRKEKEKEKENKKKKKKNQDEKKERKEKHKENH